jgi:uncharacterized protein YggE
MTNRIDIDVRISLPVPRRATHTAKMAVTAHAQAAAKAVAERAGVDLSAIDGVVITVQPPQPRRYPDPVPVAAESQADDSDPADHLPGAADGAAGSPRDRLDADTQRSAA